MHLNGRGQIYSLPGELDARPLGLAGGDPVF